MLNSIIYLITDADQSVERIDWWGLDFRSSGGPQIIIKARIDGGDWYADFNANKPHTPLEGNLTAPSQAGLLQAFGGTYSRCLSPRKQTIRKSAFCRYRDISDCRRNKTAMRGVPLGLRAIVGAPLRTWRPQIPHHCNYPFPFFMSCETPVKGWPSRVLWTPYSFRSFTLHSPLRKSCRIDVVASPIW